MNGQIFLWGLYALAATGYFLLVFVFAFSRKDKLSYICIIMLILHTLWTISSLFMRLDIEPGVKFWSRVTVITLVLLPLVIHFFMTHFSNSHNKTLTRLALGGLAICLGLTLTGNIVREPSVYTVPRMVNGQEVMTKVFECDMVWGAAFMFIYMFALLFLTFRDSLRSLEDNSKAGGVKLIFAGNTVFLAACILNCVLLYNQYPIDIIAGLINAVCIVVSFTKFRIIEFKFILKKGGVLLFFIEMIAIVYVYISINLESAVSAYFPNLLPYLMPLMLVLAMLVFNVIFSKFNENIDRMFFATEFQQRQWLREFSVNLSSKLGLDDITNTFIEAVKSVLRVRSVYLALYDEEKKEYAVNTGTQKSKINYAFAEDNPILTWLRQNDICLSRDQIDKLPIFKSLWDEETELINELELELVVPLKSRSRMIGMLILSKKQDGSSFTIEDMDLLLSLGGSTAVALDNAFSYERAKNEANTDSLTGLYNHRFFYRELRRVIEEAGENPLSLVLLDLDMFKLYNDMYGHIEGDKALETVAAILTERVGKRGVVARYGGEEFVILLPAHDSKRAEELTESIRQEVRRVFNGGPGAEKRFLSISAGICTYPFAAPNGEELLKRADIALYSAKNSGKNKIVIYAPSITMPKEEADHEIYWLTVPGNELVSHASTIFALTATIETKDYYTYGHSQKVAQYASALAAAIGLDDWHVNSIKEAALLHDIGKIGIPEDILRKVGRLNDEELEIMRRHVDMSVTIIKHLPSLQYVLPAVIGHHEAWDGTGYPRGICGEDIPISARCLTIADSFDAMMSTRPYRAGCSLDFALHEIKEKAGTQFDPFLADTFLELAYAGKIDVTPYEVNLAGKVS